MLGLLLAMLGAGVAAEVDTPDVAPDPVLQWAELDLRTTQKSRVFLGIAAAGPPAYIIGNFAVQTFSLKTGKGSNFGVFSGGTLTAAGFTGMLIGPPLLLYHARRGRVALEQQGLSVRHAGIALGASLWGLSIITSGAALDELVAGEGDDARVPLIFASATYIGALGVGAAQMRANFLARRDAGWLGDVALVPHFGDDMRGVQLAVVR